MAYMIKSIVKKSAVVIFLALGTASLGAGNNVSLTPSEPTHYLYMPMAKVNSPYHLVAGLREISFALPGRLQLQLCLVDNLGKTNLAAKYGIADNLSVGAGLASTFISMGWHGIPSGDSRLGLFLTYAFVENRNTGIAITPHTQIGDHISLGADFGLMKRMANIWSILWEAGLSADTHENDGGIFIYRRRHTGTPAARPVPFF